MELVEMMVVMGKDRMSGRVNEVREFLVEKRQ